MHHVNQCVHGTDADKGSNTWWCLYSHVDFDFDFTHLMVQLLFFVPSLYLLDTAVCCQTGKYIPTPNCMLQWQLEKMEMQHCWCAPLWNTKQCITAATCTNTTHKNMLSSFSWTNRIRPLMYNAGNSNSTGGLTIYRNQWVLTCQPGTGKRGTWSKHVWSFHCACNYQLYECTCVS